MIAEARAGGHANEQATALVCDFVYVSLVEAVAAKIIKQFYVITHPFTGNTYILLRDRGLFTEDKRDALEKRMKKKAAQEAKYRAKSDKIPS